MKAHTSPFKALVRELIARLPSSTSAQLALIRELGVAVIGRRRSELESSCAVPVVVAQRPAVGETHPRDELPPPLLKAIHPLSVPRPPRPPHGTVMYTAGDAYDDDDEDEVIFRDGPPALTARFGDINGIVASDGALYISDTENHRIRMLHDGVVSTLAGTGEGGFRDGDSDAAQFRQCVSIALDSSQGRLLVADSSIHRIRVVTMDGATTTLQ